MKVHFTKPDVNSHPLQMLMRYKSWALDTMFQSVSEISEAELTKVRPTTFKTILHTLSHIFVVDDIFKAHLEGCQHNYTKRNTDRFRSLEELREASGNIDLWYINYADQTDEKNLSETVQFNFADGGQGAMSRAEIMHHLINHATYHIGYVSDMMYQIPVEPPTTDLPVFLRDVWHKLPHNIAPQ